MHRLSSRLCTLYVPRRTDYLRLEPECGREAEIVPADKRKKVVVVGGGPGGLYAARICAQRGHQVTLLERGDELGGNFRLAAFPADKGDLTSAIRSYIVRAEEAGVTIKMNTEATVELLKDMAPDAVIFATGSVPLILNIPGLADSDYITAQDMLSGRYEIGNKASSSAAVWSAVKLPNSSANGITKSRSSK